MDFEQAGSVERELGELRERLERVEQELAGMREYDAARGQRVEAIRAEVIGEPEGRSVVVERVVESTLVDARKDSPRRGTEAAPKFASVRGAGQQRSLEDRLGSQVFNRVGIVALLIGTTWFLKWAIDNHWIGELARVIIGLAAGAALILWSERFRAKGYAAFSYSLKAVGTGVLYLSLWAGFQLYHLMPAAVALGAMVLVTAWNAFMAWAQDAEMLAAYALVGGFATPALVSSGGNHEVFLFSYLLVLNVAVLALVRLKPWSRLLLGSMPATAAYFIGWYVSWFYRADAVGVTALFVVLLFAVMAAAGAVAVQRDRVIAGVVAPMGAAAFGALAGYSVLQDSGRHAWLPWEMVALAALYLALERWQRRREKAEPAASVHLALAVVFLTIAIPLKASGRWITVGWLAEGAALLWMAMRMARLPKEHAPDAKVAPLLQVLGGGALVLGWLGAAMQLLQPRLTAEMTVFNPRFATETLGVAAVALAAWMAWRSRSADEAYGVRWEGIAGAAMITANLLALLACVREVSDYWGSAEGLARALSISGFLMVYGGALLAVGFWRRSGFVRWQGLALLVFTIAKVFVYDMRSLSSGYRVMSFLALGALLMAVSFAYQKDWLELRDGGKREVEK
jgi:uncharacterized membrane protein